MQNTFYLRKNESLKKFFKKRSNIWKSILKCSASFEIVSHPRIFCLKNHLEIIQAKISKRQTVQNINFKKESTFEIWIWCFFFYIRNVCTEKKFPVKLITFFRNFIFLTKKKKTLFNATMSVFHGQIHFCWESKYVYSCGRSHTAKNFGKICEFFPMY